MEFYSYIIFCVTQVNNYFNVCFCCSENMVSDRIPDRKVANIAASLVAAAASANGSIDEKERELNEVITGLQILREELIRRVSFKYQLY